jgi:hypothetical protein
MQPLCCCQRMLALSSRISRHRALRFIGRSDIDHLPKDEREPRT